MHRRSRKREPRLPPDLLGLVGHELAELAAEMQGLQATLSPSLVCMARTDPDLIVSLQSLDRMEQTLTNLSRLMAALQARGSRIHPVTAQDALEEISMVALRRRLGCLILARTADAEQFEPEFF